MNTTIQVNRRKPNPAKQSLSAWQDRQKQYRGDRDPSATTVEIRPFEEIRAERRSMARPNPPAAPVVLKDITLNKRYKSVRAGGKVIYAYPVEIKKKNVVLKRDLNAADSYTESRVNFDKFFVLDEA